MTNITLGSLLVRPPHKGLILVMIIKMGTYWNKYTKCGQQCV